MKYKWFEIEENDIKKMHNFKIHADGNYVVITGYSKNNSYAYTFLVTATIIKYILCIMNKPIVIGSLSKVQLGNIIRTLNSIRCEFRIFRFNSSLVLVAKNNDKSVKKKTHLSIVRKKQNKLENTKR